MSNDTNIAGNVSMYLAYLITKAWMTCHAADELSQRLAAPMNYIKPRDPEFSPTDQFFYAIHNILLHSSGVSYLLWPSRRTRHSQQRAQLLRNALGDEVRTDVELLRDRKFRDHITHMDERLDQWARDHHSLSRMIIAPRKMETPLTPEERFEHFNSSTWELGIRGDSINLRELVSSVKRVHSAAKSISEIR